ncbi:MAG: glycerophosphodiester phosphodiesterase [Asgard group archaeon]|nr:glycerophosphodiester phosphodiesterase [Asgard group archaeon]
MQKPIIYGHRGASAIEPENTIRAFRKAFTDGAMGIEFDIRITADQKIVIIHDATINRTSNGSGKVNEFTFEELQNFDFGLGEKIPLLKDVLSLFGEKYWLNIEIKEVGLEKQLADLLASLKSFEKIVVSSFIDQTLINVKKCNKEIPTAYLYMMNVKNLSKLKVELDIDGIHPWEKMVGKRLIKKAHSNNLAIRTWTVDNIRKAQNLVKNNIDGIITNNPRALIEELFEKNSKK